MAIKCVLSINIDRGKHMSEKVSVIIPVYKVEKYLEETVNAFLKQTYRNLEIILVDDGSPDNCGVICDSYAHTDSRVKVSLSQFEKAKLLGIQC